MKIRVGVIGNAPGWISLLRQEGIPYASVSDKIIPEDFSLIIVPDKFDDRMRREIVEYLKSGGSLLLSGKSYASLFDIACRHVPIQSLLAGEESLFQSVGLIDIFTECTIPTGSNELPSLDGQKTAYVGEYGGGTVIVLPFDAGELAMDTRTADKSFYSPFPRLPFEHVSLVSKGTIRKLVSQSIEYLHHQKALPYIHKWYYPDESPAIFSFRIDTDAATRSGIESVYDLTTQNKIPFSWFVDTKSQKACIDVYSSMKGQEIGIHCYEHQTYTTFAENIANITKALAVLQPQVSPIKGFAAPYGKWNNELARAIRDAEFEYSSEFAYDYDNLPSVPTIDQTGIGALQIPIHPVSIGMLRRLGYTDEMMTEYFRIVIEQKLGHREPVILYHHPNDGHEKVLTGIFSLVKNRKLPLMMFAEYASWWKRRDSLSVEAEFTKGNLLVRSQGSEPGVCFHATRSDGSEAFFSTEKGEMPASIHWQTIKPPPPIPSDLSRIRKFNPWISFIHLQDTIVGKLK